MLKLLTVATLIAIANPSLVTPCFSDLITKKEMTLQKDPLFYLNRGYTSLLSGNSRMAIRYFNNAFQFVDISAPSSCLLDFLISFGQVIAYDHQGERTLCKQAIGSLILSLQIWSNSLDSSSDFSSTLYSSNDSYLKNQQLNLENFLDSLTSQAPSEEVRDFLTDISSLIIDDLLPYFDDAKQCF